MSITSDTADGIMLDLINENTQANLQADLQVNRLIRQPAAVSPAASRIRADTSTSSESKSSNNITVNFSGCNTSNGPKAKVDVNQNNVIRISSSSSSPLISSSIETNLATPEPLDEREETVVDQERSSTTPLADKDDPAEIQSPVNKTSRSMSLGSESNSHSNDTYHTTYDHDSSTDVSLSHKQEKLLHEIQDFYFRAAKNGTLESTIQDIDPLEDVVGLTVVTPRMDRSVRPRPRSDYGIGQICWTFIVEPTSDANLTNTAGGLLVRTPAGLMLGKWRPGIVVSVLEKQCEVAELGRRGGKYLERLSLYGLLERCGVALDVDRNIDYDNFPEHHPLFRSLAEPLKVDRYFNGPESLSGWSVVQLQRTHSLGFNNLCNSCGYLTKASTTQLLAMRSHFAGLRTCVRSGYHERLLVAPLSHSLTSEERTAMSQIKNEIRQRFSPPIIPDRNAVRTILRAIVEDNRPDETSAPSSTPTAAHGLSPALEEPFDFSSTIPNFGRGVSPSIIIQKAKDESHQRWMSAEVTRFQKESLLYVADKQYNAVRADPDASATARVNLKRKRDEFEVDIKIAECQATAYRKPHKDLGGYLPHHFRAKGRDIGLCSRLSAKFNRVLIDSRRITQTSPDGGQQNQNP